MLVARDEHTYRHFVDCSKCQEMFPLLTRQTMGCGWVPYPADGVSVLPFDPIGRLSPDLPIAELEKQRNKHCPGYTCGLPDVIEASRARAWAEKRGLETFTKREQPTDALMLAVDILETESSRATDWAIKNPIKDGHGAG